MADNDWLDDLFDKPAGELDAAARQRLDVIKHVLREREEDRTADTAEPLPWSEERLAGEREALLGQLFGDKRAGNDQPALAEPQPTLKPEPGRLTQVTRYLVPVAMAASVAFFSLNLLPLSTAPDYDNATIGELLASERLPLYYDRSNLGSGTRGVARTSSTADDTDDTPGDDNPPIRVSVPSPNRLGVELIQYLHAQELPYQLDDSPQGLRLQLYLYDPHTAEINKQLAKEGVAALEAGYRVLLIRKIADPG